MECTSVYVKTGISCQQAIISTKLMKFIVLYADPVKGSKQLLRQLLIRVECQEWPPCLGHMQKHCNREKDLWLPTKTLKISSDACSLMTRNTGLNEIRQLTFI